jgi:hypothetical protein
VCAGIKEVSKKGMLTEFHTQPTGMKEEGSEKHPRHPPLRT